MSCVFYCKQVYFFVVVILALALVVFKGKNETEAIAHVLGKKVQSTQKVKENTFQLDSAK